MHSAIATATILYIDDDQELADSYSRALERAGYRVRRAADGEEGLSLARREPPDIILLDWMMPGKNGFETCVELRQIQSLRSVPIIVLTSFGQNIQYMHTPSGTAAALQIQDCLEKPVDINVLLCRLEILLAAARDAEASGEPAPPRPLKGNDVQGGPPALKKLSSKAFTGGDTPPMRVHEGLFTAQESAQHYAEPVRQVNRHARGRPHGCQQ